MKSVPYLSNLTPLRGIAALLIVIFHLDLMIFGNALISYADSGLLHRMYLMVDFFFVLSGFIMSHVYGAWFSTSVRYADFKKFTIARFARVYPLHLVTLVYTILLFYTTAQLGVPIDSVNESAQLVFLDARILVNQYRMVGVYAFSVFRESLYAIGFNR